MKKFLLSILIVLMTALPVSAEYFKDIIITSSDGLWTDERAYASLSDAITAVGASERTIVVASTETVVNLTIPENVTLKFQRGGNIANSGTLTFQTTNIEADAVQILTGSGDVDFANGTVVKTSWFSDFVEAVDQTNDDYITLLVTELGYVDADCALGDYVILKSESYGNRISANAGFTLSNIKNIECPNFQLFAGDGDFDFLDGTKLKLAWFNNLRALNAQVENEEVAVIVSGTNVVDFNEVVTDNITFDMVSEKGVFSVSVGIVLTLPSPENIIASPRQQIFTGDGTISFDHGGTVYADWWGIDGTADNVEIQSAVDSLPRADGGVIQLLPGQYSVTDETTIEKHSIEIQGAGNRHGRTAAATDEGTFIEIAGNISGSVFKFMDDPNGVNSSGCGVRDISFYGVDRAYTVTAAIHVHESDRFVLTNCDFHQIAGKAIYIQDCSQGHFSRFNIYQCGDTSDPGLDINEVDASNYTQGCTFSDFNIEVNYSASYMAISSNSRGNAFSNFGFESNPTIADSEQTFMDIDGGENQFVNVRVNSNAGAVPKIDIAGNRNQFDNVRDAGTHGAEVIKLNASYCQLNNIHAYSSTGEAYYTVVVKGSRVYNQIGQVYSEKLGGVQLEASSQFNIVGPIHHLFGAAETKTIDDAGIENAFHDVSVDDLDCSGTNKTIVTLGGKGQIRGGHIRDTSDATTAVELTGEGAECQNVKFYNLAAATALSMEHHRGLASGNKFYGCALGVAVASGYDDNMIVGNHFNACTNEITDDGDDTLIEANIGTQWAERKVVQIPFAYSDQSGSGTWDSDITIPNNAIVTRAFVDVLTTFGGDGDDSSTLAIQVEGANDIINAIAIKDGTAPWDAGMQEGIPQSDDPSTYVKTSAARNVKVVVAVNATDTALDAGEMVIFIEYVISE